MTWQILADSRRLVQEVETLPAPVAGCARTGRPVGNCGRSSAPGGEADQSTNVRWPDPISTQTAQSAEPHREIIRKGKSSKPNEVGKLVEVQEAENQIISHYEAYED